MGTDLVADLSSQVEEGIAQLRSLAQEEEPDTEAVDALQRSIQTKRNRLEILQRAAQESQAKQAVDVTLLKAEQERKDVVARATAQDLGDVFTRSQTFQDYDGRGKTGKVEAPLSLRAVATPLLTTNFPESVKGGPRYWSEPDPEFPLLNLVPTYQVPDSSFPLLTVQVKEGGATVVAEGADKPEMDFQEVSTDVSLQTIAVRTSFSRQLAEDAPFVRQMINNNLRWAVLDEVEDQVVTAITAGTIPGVTSANGTNLSHAIRNGLGTTSGLRYTANAVVIHPNDMAALDLAWLELSCCNSSPYWGLQVIQSTKMTEGTAIVGDFRRGAAIFQKGGVSLYLTDSHDDHFQKNILDALAEVRAKAVVVTAKAFAKVSVAAP